MIPLVGAVLASVLLQHPAPCAAWRAAADLRAAAGPDTVRVADSLAVSPLICDKAVAAYLHAFLVEAGAGEWRARLAVEKELESTLHRLGEQPRLLLALGHLRRRQGLRTDARRLIERAFVPVTDGEGALTARDSAVGFYLLGRLLQDEWRDWRSFGHLRGLSTGRWNCPAFSLERDAAAIPVEKPGPVDINIECPALFESIMDSDFMSDAELKSHARAGLERWLHRAIEADSSYWPAYRAILSELAFEGRWLDLERLAQAAAEVFRDDYRPRLLLGLAAYRQERYAQASTLFDTALGAMPDEVAVLFRQPTQVLSVAEKAAFAAQPGPLRTQLAEAYWRSRRVSFLTEGNDRLVEHYARLAEADAIFALPARGIAGWNTAPGAAWVRFGRPLKVRDLAVENGRASFWTYGPDPDLVFTRHLTFAEYRVHEYFTGQMELMHERLPTRFRPPSVDSVIPVAHQLARFRGDSGSVDLVVVAVGTAAFRARAARTETGVTVLDREFREVARWRSPTLRRSGIAVTVEGLAPGRSYNVAVELHDRERRVLGQARDTLTTLVPAGRPALSDMLLVRDVSGPPGAARSRDDLRVRHLSGRTVQEGSQVGLVWEVYDLTPDSGIWRYRVGLQVKEAEGRSVLSRILGGGRGARPATGLEYDRTVEAVGNRTVEWVNFAGEWKPGRYEVVVQILDLVTGESATTTAPFVVAARDAERR